MDVVLSLVGAAVIVLVLRDVFHTLWHPAGEGRLSGVVGRATWWAVHRLPQRSRLRRLLLDLAGPMVLAVVVVAWVTGVIVGWSFVFWPHMPDAFEDSTGAVPTDVWERMVATVYVSMVGLSTLGLGDIAPTTGWTRICTALQAVVGFALLSASVSWVLQVAPALTQRRALARRLTAYTQAQHGTSEDPGDGGGALRVSTLDGLVADFSRVHVQLGHYGETYYFRDADPSEALPAAVGVGANLVEVAALSTDPEVRRSARSLRWTLDRFAELLDGAYLRTGGSSAEVFAAYAADQDHEPVSASRAESPGGP